MEVVKNTKYRKAVFIVVYSIDKDCKVDYLLLKRKLHWRGWEFPKGGRERFETKRQAVERELFEETGLKPKSVKMFDYKGRYYYKRKLQDRPGIKGQTFQLFAVEVEKPKNSKIKIDKKEHSDFKWLPFDKAYKLLTWPNQKKSLKLVNNWLKGKS